MTDPTPHVRASLPGKAHRLRPTGWDRWAPVYAVTERLALGRELQRAREAAADVAAAWVGSSPGPAPSRWLVLGDGDGRGLEALVRALPQATFVSVDGSRAMLARARRRLKAGPPTSTHLSPRPPITWIHADLVRNWPDLPRDAPFDGIVTSFFLDCLTPDELMHVWSEGAARLQPGGAWIVTDFLSPSEVRRAGASSGMPGTPGTPGTTGTTGTAGRWRSLRQALLLRLLYAAFRASTSMDARELPDLAAPFADAGWALESRGHSPSLLTEWRLWRRPDRSGGAGMEAPTPRVRPYSAAPDADSEASTPGHRTRDDSG